MRLLKIGLLSAACGLTLAAASVSAQPPREGDRPAGQRGDRPQGDRPQGDRPQGDRPEGDRPQGERGGRGFGGGFGGPGGPGGGRMMMARLPIMAALDADGNGEISASEIEGAVAALKKLDKNSDGKLTMEELMPEGMMAGGPGGGPGGPGGPGGGFGDPAEIVNRMLEADKNKDGFIDKSEAPERMQPMFARADTDNDGKLSKDELTKAASQMGRRGGAEGGREGGREGAPREGERPRRPSGE